MGSFMRSFHSLGSMRLAKSLGSNEGWLTIARTSPVRGSRATTAPGRSPRDASAAICRSRSMVRRRSFPGLRVDGGQHAHFLPPAVHHHAPHAVAARREPGCTQLPRRTFPSHRRACRMSPAWRSSPRELHPHNPACAAATSMLGVEPLLHLDQVELGIFHAVGFEKGNVFKRGGLLQQHGLEARQAGGALKGGAEFLGVQLQSPGDSGDAVRREVVADSRSRSTLKAGKLSASTRPSRSRMRPRGAMTGRLRMRLRSARSAYCW